MEIRKQYNIGQLAEQLQTEIEKSKKYNGAVKLDILTANNILDVLNETNRRKQKHQTNLMEEGKKIAKVITTEGNLLEVSRYDDCFGEYKGEGNTKCLYCCLSDTCRDKTKNKEKKIAKVITMEQKTEHRGCSGKYDEDNLDCLKCACGDECMKETKRTEIVRVSYCSEVGCKFNSATKCITTPEMRVQNNECMSNTCSTRYLIPDDNLVSEDEEEGETNE